MKLVVALVLVGAALWIGVPRDVVHTRCLKPIGDEDGLDWITWVTRDGVKSDVLIESCHPVRFRRAAGFEWLPSAAQDSSATP